MDPQRQYAQLLTLWSEGSKMFRRKAFLSGTREDVWDVWWRIGRRLVERGLMVLPMPLSPPSLLVATAERWWTLIDERDYPSGVVHGLVISVRRETYPALSWTDHWCVNMELVLRMGERGFTTLTHWPNRDMPGELDVDDVDHALTLMGSLHRMPKMFRALPMSDWVMASRLMRHPRTRLSSPYPLPEQWGFRYNAEQGLAWFERQDEDSVHKR